MHEAEKKFKCNKKLSLKLIITQWFYVPLSRWQNAEIIPLILPMRQVRKMNPHFFLTALTLNKNGHLGKTHGEYEVDTSKFDYVLKTTTFCYYF